MFEQQNRVSYYGRALRLARTLINQACLKRELSEPTHAGQLCYPVYRIQEKILNSSTSNTPLRCRDHIKQYIEDNHDYWKINGIRVNRNN